MYAGAVLVPIMVGGGLEISASEITYLAALFGSGLSFSVRSIISMSIVAIVFMIETTGIYYALGDMTHTEVNESALRRGYLSQGLGLVIGSIFNTFPFTGFSQNVGIIQIRRKRGG